MQIFFIKIRDEVARNRQKNESRIPYFLEYFARGLLISPFVLCAVNSRVRYIRECGLIQLIMQQITSYC